MQERKEHQPDEESNGENGDTGASDASPAADRPPHAPADDDSPLGDTDQHSDA
jgi:hypothetical protein